MSGHCAFFYGTLMAPEVLNRVCYGRNRPEAWQVRSRTVTPAILPDYCRHKVRHCDYPAIIRSEGGSVRGTFVTGLTAGDIWRLDIFEGSQYKRIKVSVKLLAKVHEDSGTTHAEGDEVEAETYVWIESEDDLEDGEWDFVEFQREKMRRWTGQSDEYTEVDEASQARSSDPTGGRGFNGNIAKELDQRELEEAVRSAV